MRMRAASGREPQPQPALLGRARAGSCDEGASLAGQAPKAADAGADATGAQGVEAPGGATASDEAIDGALEAVGFGAAQIWVMALCGVAWLVDALEQAGLVYAFPDIDAEWGTAVKDWGVLGSVKALCSMFGAVGFGMFADRDGRRPAFRVSLGITALGGIASAGAGSFRSLLALRAATSIGAGGLLPAAASLLAEHLPPSRRESCLALMQVFFASGALLALGLASWLLAAESRPGSATTSPWRLYVLGLAVPPATLLVLAGPQVPESPAHLYRQGARKEAQESLRGMARRNGTLSPELERLLDELPQALSSVQAAKAPGPCCGAGGPSAAVGLGRLLAPGVRAKAAMVGALWACVTLGSDLWYWVTELGAQRGVARHAVEGLLAGCRVVGICGFFFAAFAAMRSAGMRALAGACVACGALSILLAALAAKENDTLKASAAVLLLLSFAYDMVWSLVYATTASAFDPACRATALSLASACGRISATVAPLVSGALLARGGPAAFALWAAGWTAAAAVSGRLLVAASGAATEDQCREHLDRIASAGAAASQEKV